MDINALQPHQQRVVEEHKQLKGNLERLNTFIVGKGSIWTALSDREKELLIMQAHAMQSYAAILVERIRMWVPDYEQQPTESGG